MTSVNVTTNKNTITVQEGDATTVTVATQGPQGPQGPGGAATIDDDSLDEVKLNIHADPSGTNKFLGYTSNGMEWAVPPDTNTTYSVGDNGLTKNNFTDALKTKLDSVESNSTADMTGSEIKTAYEAESDTNAFTDAEKTKLSGIATSANNYAISSDLLDEDNMATNSATKVPSQQSVKAYVDANSGTTYTAGTGLNLSGTEFSVTSLALTTVQEAANESAQLSLTTQEGDVVVRTDENKTYVRNAGTAGTMADFTLLRTPTDAVLSVNGNTGAITAAQIASAVEAASDSNTFTDADHTKLNGIETSATADQTGAEIKTAYEAESDTNAYTDAEKTKLAGIEASATADQTDAEIRAAVEAASDSNVFTDADHTKLNGIEASATADMTGAEIKTAYEAESDTNAFTDSEKTKLSGIATSANNYSISSDLLDEDNMASDSATKVPSQQSVKAYVDANGGGSDTNTTYGISCVDGDNSDEEKIRLTAGGSGSGTDDVVLEAGTGLSIARSGDKITFTNTVTDTNTQLTTEEVQDIIGAMVAGNTETNISVTYDDTNGKLDFVSTDTNTTYSVVTSSANGLAPQLPGSHGGKFLKADGTWEVPPDTNTQVNIDDTPVNGVTDEAISSNWAYDHNAATGNSAHVPAAGSSGQFLKHDGTWGTPPDTTYSVQDGQLSQNNFTDADHTKLDGIEASANVTDATNVDSAGAVMNSDLDGKGEILIGDGSGDPTALAVGTNDYVLTADSNEATGVKWAAVSSGSGDIEGVTAGIGLTGGGTSGTVTVNADVGIGDDKLVQMDDADAADDDYAKFTANGLEGRSAAEVKTDLSLNNVENTAVSTWAGSSNITTLGTVSTVTSTAVATAGVRKIHASTSAPGNSDGAVGDLWVKY